MIDTSSRTRLGRMAWPLTVMVGCVMVSAVGADPANKSEVLPSIDQRFAEPSGETPNFQKHVVPLMGRLGCNGRNCHGSFQGRGGFMLSLFGYDFKADHDQLMAENSGRVDPADPDESLILSKPLDADAHEGGKRFDEGSWQHHVLRDWIAAGAKFAPKDVVKLNKLVIEPAEITFAAAGETVQLKAVAVWADGTREDVTPLGRFTSNDDAIATVGETGLVTAGDPGDSHIIVAYDMGVVAVPVMRPVSGLTGDAYPAVATTTEIDRLIVDKLKKLGIVPSPVCDDATFLRRVRLDVTGTLPTAAEVRAFLADTDPEKRSKMIDQLLETPEYVAWWTTKLCDFTGNNDQSLNNTLPVNTAPAKVWYDWIAKRVAANVSYDEIVAGLVESVSREPKESYQEYCERMSRLFRSEEGVGLETCEAMPLYWSRNNVRQPEEKAISFAYSFLGIRIECAQCHKHPFDQWSKQDFDNFKGMFTGIRFSANPPSPDDRKQRDAILKSLDLDPKLNGGQLRQQIGRLLTDGKTVPFPEVIVNVPARAPARDRRAPGRTEPVFMASVLGGELTNIAKKNPQAMLVEWLRGRNNPYFARAFANRVWAAYFNRGLVQPADDLSLGNPAANEPVLAYLADQFLESGYDMKTLHRLVLNSDTYQRSWEINDTNALDERNFSRAVVRRLPAEVVADAVRMSLAPDALIAKMDERTLGRRAISVPGTRAGGLQFAFDVFGRSVRESNCECDRTEEVSLLQVCYLQNDNDVLAQLEARDSWINEVLTGRSVASGRPDRAVTEQVAKLTAERRSLQRQLERARGLDADQTAKLRRALREVETKLAAATRGQARTPTPTLDDARWASVIEEAYLRTLSRPPRPEEVETARTFVSGAPSPTDGLRGLMWALINTKEFIVNH